MLCSNTTSSVPTASPDIIPAQTPLNHCLLSLLRERGVFYVPDWSVYVVAGPVLDGLEHHVYIGPLLKYWRVLSVTSLI